MRAIGLSVLASSALVATYLALGGASYAPAKVADPCAQRDWRDPADLQAIAEQMVLSALDGAACELGVSREEMILAFGSRESFERFARERGLGTDKLEVLARSGLVRAINDAAHAGALEPATAERLRDIARGLRISELLDFLDLLRGA